MRAFEPLAENADDGEKTAAYMEAFAKLDGGDSGAMAAFAALVGKYPDDALASFRLKRLLNGASSTRIAMD